MHFNERLGHLTDGIESHARRQSFADALAQIAAWEIFHHNVRMRVGLTMTEDLSDIGMADLRDEIIFLQKALQEIESAFADVEHLEHARGSGRLVFRQECT